MKNDLPNTAIAPVTELPESVRIPLHSLWADLEYLIGRVIADGSCGPMVVKSVRDRLDQIESAVRAITTHPDGKSPEREAVIEECARVIDPFTRGAFTGWVGTPGPWNIDDASESNYGCQIAANTKVKAKRVVCRLGGPDRDANAAFIVMAVNNHEALVKALEEILKRDTRVSDGGMGYDLGPCAIIAKRTLADVGGSR